MPVSSFEVDVNPAVLKWARVSAGIEVLQVARRLGRSVAVVEKWESGDRRPTMRALEDLAAYYKRPLTALLLDQPPAEPPLPRDFRTLPAKARPPLSKETRLAIRTARRLQEVATRLSDDLGGPSGAALPTITTRKSPEKLADEERQRLGISVEGQEHWTSPHMAFREWRQSIERQAVLVFQMPMPVTEARGFSLVSGGIPTVVVNKSDAIHARIFTLFHEYAHVLISTPGICIPKESPSPREQIERIETFCNQFAAAFLLPADELRKTSAAKRFNTVPEEVLATLSRRFRVSREVVLRRLWTAKLISKSRYEQSLRKLTTVERPKDKRPGFVPVAPPQRCLQDRGRYFTSLILQAENRQLITRRDVADYLDVKVKDLRKLRSLI